MNGLADWTTVGNHSRIALAAPRLVSPEKLIKALWLLVILGVSHLAKEILPLVPGFSFGFGEGFDTMLGELNFLAFQEFRDRKNLEARVAAGMSSADSISLRPDEVGRVAPATIETVVTVVAGEPVNFLDRLPRPPIPCSTMRARLFVKHFGTINPFRHFAHCF
jgi:hypothetical protein